MNVRSPEAMRRHIRRQSERRKAKRRATALAALEEPISLVLEAVRSDQVPLEFLPLHDFKNRIEELNVAMILAGPDSGGRRATEVSQGWSVNVERPAIAKKKHLFPLEAFERSHHGGRLVYDYMVRRGRVASAAGEWSYFNHASLVAALPELRLEWGRRRVRYLVKVDRDPHGAVTGIGIYSVNYVPLRERQFKRAAPD